MPTGTKKNCLDCEGSYNCDGCKSAERWAERKWREEKQREKERGEEQLEGARKRTVGRSKEKNGVVFEGGPREIASYLHRCRQLGRFVRCWGGIEWVRLLCN
jgi:hypothetical protein